VTPSPQREGPRTLGSVTSYAAAGVDIEAGDRAVELMKGSVSRASRPEVVGGLGGFAGLFRLDLTRWKQPLLASSTDGVGTKLVIAQALDKHDTVGIDLVAMVVDDLVVCGAEPLFLQDYIAIGKVDPVKVAAIVSGIAEGCRRSGCALVGGETAEHPGVMEPQHYDLAATGVGAVESDDVLGPQRVRAGDAVVAMASSGLHSNGFSLVRHVVRDLDLATVVPELGRTLGEELLEPTRIYALDCLEVIRALHPRVFCHVTGGGIAGNLVRVLPEGLGAVLDRGTWEVPAIFELVRSLGEIPVEEMDKTLNLGVGMIAVVPPDEAAATVALLEGRGVPSWVLGEVTEEPGVRWG
jgi:phosphoribosylformylglycinamidine cyclo-ligase